MPFKVRFNIIGEGKAAPLFTTDSRDLAYIELKDRQRKEGILSYRLVHEIEPMDLSKSEEYVWLVYRVRKAIRRFFDRGRKREDLMTSLALEKELDGWNERTRKYVDSHPGTSGDEKSFAFFVLVERWRQVWHQYYAYKKRRDKDKAVEREMKKACFDYEREIDKYVAQEIGL